MKIKRFTEQIEMPDSADDLEIELLKLELSVSGRNCFNQNLFPMITRVSSLLFIADWVFVKSGYDFSVFLTLI